MKASQNESTSRPLTGDAPASDDATRVRRQFVHGWRQTHRTDVVTPCDRCCKFKQRHIVVERVQVELLVQYHLLDGVRRPRILKLQQVVTAGVD